MLKHVMVAQGRWLFRWRSYLPLLLLPFAVNTFLASGWMTQKIGAAGEELWDFFCVTVALIGLAIRVLTVGSVPGGTSGRNTGRQKAATLNTTGMYSIVRHPLYLGNFFVFIGFVLVLKSALFVLFATIAYFLYYERIILAEEDFLAERHPASFSQWASRTPIIIPRLTGWVASSLPFSWQAALRREFHTVFLIAVVFFVSEFLESTVIEHTTPAQWIADEPHWAIFAGASAVFYVVVMVVKKTTTWLRVSGR